MMNIRRAIGTYKIYRQIPDWDWAKTIVELQVSLRNVSLDPQSHKLRLKPFDVLLSKKKHDFILGKKGFLQAQALKKNFGTKFYLDQNDDLVVNIEGMKATIQTEEEITILEEIFLQGVYNLIYDKPVVMWDIGMNVGIASLYFATQPNVVSVFSYEPFKKTYQQALHNIQLNPDLAKKINPFSYGVGGSQQTLTVEYTPDMRGSVGVDGLPDRFKTSTQTFLTEEIDIKPASEVLDSIQSQYPNTDIVAKIDCEGSEYDIIPTLHANGKLSSLRAVLMEWHQKGPDPLVECLRQAGFAIFSRRPKSKTIGMIYAIRV